MTWRPRPKPTEDQLRERLRLLYGMTDISQDPDDGTWWIGSELRPNLLNMESLDAALQYLDSLPDQMINSLTRPRGSDSEPHRKEG